MSHNFNSLGSSDETAECKQFFYKMKDYVQEIIAQRQTSPMPLERQQYFIKLGKAVYENMKDVNYIGMNQVMDIYRKKFRDQFSADLDDQIETNGVLSDKANLTVGMAFVDIFSRRIAEWEKIMSS